MDPIAAYKKQLERNGTTSFKEKVEKTSEQLRELNPRWATIFDRMDTSHDGFLQLNEVMRGFKQILGAGSQVPEHCLKDVFVKVDTEGTGNLDFKQFCDLAHKVSAYMMDHPKWAQEEAALDAEDEKKRIQLEKEQKKARESDIFAVLGLPKSKDLCEVEARKKRALEHAKQERRLSLSSAGNTIVRSNSGAALGSGSRPDSGNATSMKGAALASLGARRFAMGLKRSQVSIESTTSTTTAASAEEIEIEPDSPTKKLREAWERFSLSSARGRTKRQLANVRQLHLPDYLPQIRALGKHNAGCFALRFSPDGSQLAGGFFDGGVRIFDVDKGLQAHCMNLPKYKGGSVKSAEEHERDELLKAKYGEEHRPAPMDLDQEVDLSSITKKWEPVTNVRWRPGGDGKQNTLASVDTKGCLSLWDVPRSKEHRPSRCLTQVETGGALTSLAWTCDGSSVAVAGADKVIKLYDAQEEMGKVIFTAGQRLGETVAYCGKCTGHALKIVSLVAHPTTPEVFVSAGLDRQVLVWDTRAGTVPQNQISGLDLAGDAMDISRDGNTILTGSHRSKKPIEIYDLRMTEDAKPTLSYSWVGNETRSEGGGRWTTSLLFSTAWDGWENRTIVAAGENENLARVYQRPADAEEPLQLLGTLRGKGEAFWSSAISTDARSVAFGSCDGAVCIVDVTQK